MLQDLIKDLQSSLKTYSQGLAKQNLLVDIPWTLIDGDFGTNRLIFKKNGILRTVSEGFVIESSWEYEPGLDSLILEIGNQKFLMKEVFLDGTVLILKRDGVNLDFIAFADGRKIDNLNVIEYLKSFKGSKEQINTLSETAKNDKSEGDSSLIALGVIAVIFLVIFFIIENFN